MLLFIVMEDCTIACQLYFNTSHVTVYPFLLCNCLCSYIISIHLMLLFIYVRRNGVYEPAISIHLMLLFIRTVDISLFFQREFQYISCYCLSPFYSKSVQPLMISIHLMLLFILVDGCKMCPLYKFQYISCYCLSGRGSSIERVSTFQYISCYCLSYLIHLKQYQLSLFQYISCYCLSNQHPTLMRDLANFNTSHVTVYRKLCTK